MQTSEDYMKIWKMIETTSKEVEQDENKDI